MAEREQRRYMIGMIGIMAIAVSVLLLFFHMELQRLDSKYNSILQDMMLEIQMQWNDDDNATIQMQDFLRQHGYLDMRISKMYDEIVTGWDRIIVFCIVLLCGLFFIQITWGGLGFRKVYRRIDRGVDLLTEIVGESKNENISMKWEKWREECKEQYRQGTVGRFYKQIWETAQIVREREEDRKEEQNYLRRMMSDISHQIKTPLSSLQVFIDIFSDRIASEPAVQKADTVRQKHTLKEMAVQANRQIERMRWLITGLLNLANIESGVLQWDIKRQPICYTLEKSIDAIGVKLAQKKQRVEMTGDREILLNHDTDWMQEALANIIKNASEHAPEEGVIKVCVEQTALAVVITIEDCGEGIAREELPKIFNRFYRVRKKGDGDGVGIGLALAKSIVETQGGTITVFSQTGEASYTRFVLTFLQEIQEAPV